MSVNVVNATTGLIERHPDSVARLFKKHHIQAAPNHRNMWLALRARKRPFFEDLMKVIGGIGATWLATQGGSARGGQELRSLSPTKSSIGSINPGSGSFHPDEFTEMGSFTGEESNATGRDDGKRERLYNALVTGLNRYNYSKDYDFNHRRRYFPVQPWRANPYGLYPFGYGGFNSNGIPVQNYDLDGADASAAGSASVSGSVDLGINKTWIYFIIAGLVALYLFNKK